MGITQKPVAKRRIEPFALHVRRGMAMHQGTPTPNYLDTLTLEVRYDTQN